MRLWARQLNGWQFFGFTVPSAKHWTEFSHISQYISVPTGLYSQAPLQHQLPSYLGPQGASTIGHSIHISAAAWGPPTHADKLLIVPANSAAHTNVLCRHVWMRVYNYTCNLFIFTQCTHACVLLFGGRCQNVFVMLMRMEVCWWSDGVANGPAGCENLFHCLSLFSTLVWLAHWVFVCVGLNGKGSRMCQNMYVSTEL